jgi:small subunit ribosomal protein S20
MPILKNAKKALRVSKRKAEYKRPVKSRVKTMTDKVKKEPTAANLSSAFSAIDRAVKKNIFHKNKAARIKAQISKLLKK